MTPLPTRLSAVGSCRIVTPLRRGAARHGFVANQKRNYGFVHSSAEIVQQVRFLLGDWQPDPLHWSLISPKADLQLLSGTGHPLSDLYVIEISSLKRVTIPAGSIQINYLRRLFPALLDDAGRAARFWEMAATGDQDRIDASLAAWRAEGLIDAGQADLLGQVRIDTMTPGEISRDVAWLLAHLPRIVFQTHVDAATAEGQLLPDRAKLIAAVETAVHAAGGTCYNPTALMRRIGQDRAMAHGSTAHWTDDFSDSLFDDLWQTCIERETAAAPFPTPPS